MEALSFSEMAALIGIPFLVAGTVANIYAVTNARVRNFIFVGLGMGCSFVLGLVMWSLFWREYRLPGTEPPPKSDIATKVTPSPTPTPRNKKGAAPTPPAPTPETPPSTPGVPIYASSLDNPAARAKYCVVGEIVAESNNGPKSLVVTVSQANLSLCNYSAHGARRVALKIGILNASPANGKKSGGILWSSSVTLAERLNPGETYSTPSPIDISIPKRGKVDLANAKFVVQLSNVPYDTKREMKYYLSGEDAVQLAQIGRD